MNNSIVVSLAIWTLLVTLQPSSAAQGPEFHGPYPEWINVRDCGAVGDGKADDTGPIQEAIRQTLRDDTRAIVYFPAGIYRITRTIELPPDLPGIDPEQQRFWNRSVIGEDPANTVLQWDGEPQGVMLWMRAVHSTSIRRLTLDGASRAKICLRIERDSRFKLYSSYGRVEDMTFRNAGIGLANTDLLEPRNDMDAEYSVLRCRFEKLSEAGASIDPGNGFDYWFRHCRFEDCAVGVRNIQGDFRVHNCLFLRSSDLDIQASGHRDGGIRGCVSIGSNRFAEIRSSFMTIQGNRIIDPVQTDAIRLETMWSLQLLDNEIRSRAPSSGPVIRETSGADQGPVTAIGNTFTTPDPMALAHTNTVVFNNRIVDRDSISEAVIELPAAPPRVERPTFVIRDVKQARQVLDQAIEHARQHPNSRPVVRLPILGSHTIDAPLEFPADLPLFFEGDGPLSRLDWGGDASDPRPLVILRGPSRVTMSNIYLHTPNRAIGDHLLIETADQPNGLIRGDNLAGRLIVDALCETNVDFHDFCDQGGVKVIGPSRPGPARVAVFAGASSGEHTVAHVERGGRLLIQDLWYEGGPSGPWAIAQGRGTQLGELSIQSAFVFQGKGELEPIVEARDFEGRIALLGGRFIGSSRIVGDGSRTQFLSLGSHAPLIDESPPPARSFSIESEIPGFNILDPRLRRPLGTRKDPVDEAWLLQQLAFVRATQPAWSYTPRPAGTTDVSLSRVTARIRIQASQAN